MQLCNLADDLEPENPRQKAQLRALLEGAVFQMALACKNALLQYATEPCFSAALQQELVNEQNILVLVKRICQAPSLGTELGVLIKSMGEDRINSLCELYAGLWLAPRPGNLESPGNATSVADHTVQLIAVVNQEASMTLSVKQCRRWIDDLYQADQAAVELSVES